MDKSMLAVVKDKKSPGVTLKQIPIPKPKKDEVLIKVLGASICGTDIGIYDWIPWAASHIKPPIVIGHEVVGEIIEINSSKKTTLKIGDIVSSETHIYCLNCYQCKIKNYHVCENMQLFGIGRDGAFAQYATIPIHTTWKNDPSVDIEVMSVQEPLGNAVNVVTKAQVKGKKVLIMGLGPTGLCAGAVAFAYGAKEIVGVNDEPYRRELAESTGWFNRVVSNVPKKEYGTFDVVLEMSGNRLGIEIAFDAVRIAGKIIAFGIPKENISLDWGKYMINKELTIESVFGRMIWDTWHETTRLLKEKQVDLKKTITHRFPLSQFEQAMEIMKSRKSGKIVLVPDDPTASIYKKSIDSMKEKGLFNDIKIIESGQGAYLKINGKNYLNLCSNNYLGLASDTRLTEAVKKAVTKYGVGTASVRALSGTNILHIQLEQALAEFKHAEAALVLQGGYMANLASVQTLLGKEDIIISDELNHASIIDAIRIAQIQNKFVYKHADMKSLEEKLKEAQTLMKTKRSDGEDRVLLIVTDGVFSMDGDMAPLPEIVKLAKEYSALTMVDDAHGEGVLGKNGRGIVDHFKLHGEVDLEVGTLSKAFGVIGGFITGKKDLIEYLRQKARQFLFSNGLSIPDTAALIEAVKIMGASDKQVKKLWENTDYLKKGLKALGFDLGRSTTPITPVMIGDENIAKEFTKKLFEQGIYVTAIKFPMVALGKARIRVMPSATHSKKDLDLTLTKFKKVAKELKLL